MNTPKRFVGGLMTAGLLLVSLDAPAAHVLIKRLCFAELIEVPEIVWGGPVPVGCEIIDCCPGCPGPPDFLDWRISLEGEAVGSVVLQFENMPQDMVRKLEVSEGGQWMDDGRLIIKPGQTTIKGLPAMLKGRAPVITPEVRIGQAWRKAAGKRVQSYDADASDDASPDAGGGTMVIEQILGGRFIVNRFKLVFTICRPQTGRGTQDRVDVDMNALDDNTVILLDGRRKSCVNDEVQRTTNIRSIGNMLSRGRCNEEIVVFSDNDAMQLIENPGWTDNTGDLEKAVLTPDVIQAPVTVWLIRNNANLAATADIAQASLLYNGSNCGIAFNANIQNLSNNANAANTVAGTAAAPQCSNQWLNNLTGSAFFNAGQLNAYYTNQGLTAFNCIANGNVSVVGTLANNQSLAHEFGHAYTLGHTNAVAAIPTTNVMHGGGAGRTQFTEGQCFRVNINQGSVLNTNGDRAGTTRNCPDGTSSATCPALSLDVAPN